MMPINTERKRRAAATVTAVWNGPPLKPGGGFDAFERGTIGYSYLPEFADIEVFTDAFCIQVPPVDFRLDIGKHPEDI